MSFIKLYEESDEDFPGGMLGRSTEHPRILIFTEGTVTGPKHWWQFFNDKGYVPIGHAPDKIRQWETQGARIAYLTSRRKPADAAAIREILRKGRFPGYGLFYRGEGEEYHDIAEQVIPDILIEDDCRSIGGQRQMTITLVRDELKPLIHSIVVREFGGIDHLPDAVGNLFLSEHI